MGRLVILLVIVWLVYSITRRWIASLEQKKQQKQQRPLRISTMVSCAHCGLHVPQDEAVQAGGKYYCSDEHKKLSGSV